MTGTEQFPVVKSKREKGKHVDWNKKGEYKLEHGGITPINIRNQVLCEKFPGESKSMKMFIRGLHRL